MFPEGSRDHANHTPLQGNEKERQMTDTSGRKCLGQFERYNRAGSWAKTFSALLIGTGDWYSRRCKLTWKLKGTKYNRMYFQLAPSTPPHRRDRVWFVAYSKLRSAGQDRNSDKAQGGGDTSIHPQGQGGDGKAIFDSGLCGLQGATPDAKDIRSSFSKLGEKKSGKQVQAGSNINRLENMGVTPDAPDIGLQQPRGAWERWAGFTHNGSVPDWGNFPQTQPTIRSGDDGFSSRLDGITFPKWRNESIKAAGNAIVPQVAYQIFRAIELYEIQNGAK